MVGDSVNDVLSARAARVPVICVRYGYNNGEDIVEARPDAIIDSLAELSDFI
ncbi:MAG: HAD hydrolase-like protein [Gammaproteobacteria bacterium]